MEATSADVPVDHSHPSEAQGVIQSSPTNVDAKSVHSSNRSPDHPRCKQHRRSKKKSSSSKKSKKQRAANDDSSSSTSSSDDESSNSISTTSDSSSASSSDDQNPKHKKKRKTKKAVKKSKSSSSKKKDKKERKQTKRSKHRSVASDSDSSESESSDDESSHDERRSQRRKKCRSQKRPSHEDSEYDTAAEEEAILQNDHLLQLSRLAAGGAGGYGGAGLDNSLAANSGARRLRFRRGQEHLPPPPEEKSPRKSKKHFKAARRASTLAYKRVDQLWDSTIHNYKLTESARDQEDEFDQYVFTVRRRFDWENKYKNTVVDIKSKFLRDALQEVMKDVKGVSLVEDRPSVDPNMLFLYLEELRKYTRETLKTKLKTEKKRKNKKKLSLTISQCKVLIEYLDQDYEETKKTLHPMLEAGNITFELLWALFKPNSIAYTPTYGNTEEPRCFKVDYATKESSFMRGEWYSIEGRYLEYDGRSFGLGEFEAQIDAFKGPRKITSLATYPLIYHKDPETVKQYLLERGKKFVSLEGMNYRYHQGMAFMKKKKVVAKVNINGRIMVDPAIFRRINPNYPISTVKPQDQEGCSGLNGNEESEDDCCSSSDDEHGHNGNDGDGAQLPADENGTKEKSKFKVLRDKDDNIQIVQVAVDEQGQEERMENLDKLADDADSKQKHEFTEEELLIASPVVLGFAFSEKLWLEFSISGLRSIDWNEGAFDSLVLPTNQKSIVRALVESHKFHAAKTIDDVVQGKGKGLVAVLHGPPGTGKTLTAEGIAELLKCPLYMVSAGELGTDPRMLESELQKILDIAHSWGAVLLLDEADVFLEKREVHDIHRNALVSIFLRLLEYFQGILFLTTNRVETFDDAFQSRIHVALRYGELTTKAKKAVWKMFLAKVREMEQAVIYDSESSTWDISTDDDKPSVSKSLASLTVVPAASKSPLPTCAASQFKESEYDSLARRPLNGRQIKNVVRTSQALAVNRKEPLAMRHILEVLEVAESFEHDLKGGTGYMDAMRSYT